MCHLAVGEQGVPGEAATVTAERGPHQEGEMRTTTMTTMGEAQHFTLPIQSFP